MNIEKNIQELRDLVEQSGKNVMFDSAVTVKLSPHLPPFKCYGIRVNNERLEIISKTGEWNIIHKDQANVTYIVGSLLQRIKLLKASL